MIRKAVYNEICSRMWTVNHAAVELSDIVSRAHLYDWLRGTHNLSDNKAAAILERLDLEIVPSDDLPPK